MIVAVAVLGILFLGVGLTILVVPRAARWSLENMITRRMMPVYSIVRLAFGIACILAGPSTRLPGFVWAFGLLLILSAVSLQVMGFERIQAYSRWWLEKPDGMIRGWSLVAILLGALLVWSAT